MSASDGLKTGEVAKLAGVNIQTVRFYEREGLLEAPGRRPSGYRAYPEEAVRVVRFIKRAQYLGFTLKEVESLVRLRATDRIAACDRMRDIARSRVTAIDEQLAALTAVRQELHRLVGCCAPTDDLECPILAALDGAVPPERPSKARASSAGRAKGAGKRRS